MHLHTEQFKTKLYERIADIERHSLVEIVVAFKPRSSSYIDIVIWWGVAATFLAFTFFMFYPVAFTDLLIYGGTVGAFFIGALIPIIIKPLHRLFIPRDRMKKATEIYGRAMFQKGGIRHTVEKTGLLILVSIFEKQVVIIPDTGVENAIPPEEWKKICKDFHSIFKERNLYDALINRLANHKPVFNRFVPPIEGDINELPDNLEIDL